MVPLGALGVPAPITSSALARSGATGSPAASEVPSLASSVHSNIRRAKARLRNRSRDRLHIFPATSRKGQDRFHCLPPGRPERACLLLSCWCLPPEHSLELDRR